MKCVPLMCHVLTDGKEFPPPLDNGKCEEHLFLRPVKNCFETFAGFVHWPFRDLDEFQENGLIGLYNLRYWCWVYTKRSNPVSFV